MKSFQFSLESVLEYRREIEQEWEMKLGAAVGECNRLELRIETLEQEERDALNKRDYHSAFQVEAWGRYCARLRQNRDYVKKDLAVATKKMEEVRKGYLEAARNRKGLDKLKEKKLKEYKKYLQRQEILEMDQMAAAKAHRLSEFAVDAARGRKAKNAAAAAEEIGQEAVISAAGGDREQAEVIRGGD